MKKYIYAFMISFAINFVYFLSIDTVTITDIILFEGVLGLLGWYVWFALKYPESVGLKKNKYYL